MDPMLVVHATLCQGELRIWAEDGALCAAGLPNTGAGEGETFPHPYAATGHTLSAVLRPFLTRAAIEPTPGSVRLRLPRIGQSPAPSPRLAHDLPLPDTEPETLGQFDAPCLSIAPVSARIVLEGLLDAAESERLGTSALGLARPIACGKSIEFWLRADRLARHLLAQQRIVPMLAQDSQGALSGIWLPWLADEATIARCDALLRAMPPIARASVDALGHDAWSTMQSFVSAIVDASARDALARETMRDTITDQSADDPHVGWLSGLLGSEREVPGTPAQRQEMVRRVRTWIGRLDERGMSAAWRLCLRLNEPQSSASLADLAAPPDELEWTLSFHLQSVDRPDVMVDAQDIWMLSGDSASIEGLRLDSPQELLLAELGRASRIYERLERALDAQEPSDLSLNTRQAYQYLREIQPVLREQGFGSIAPDWWDSPSARIGARLKVSTPETPGDQDTGATPSPASARLGMAALVNYKWEIALGDTTLTMEEFQQLASRKSPLIRVNGRWVEVRPEDVQAAMRFIKENASGTMTVAEALRVAYGTDPVETGVPIVGLEMEGWIKQALSGASEQVPTLLAPDAFHGTLRPYQERGLSWMAFLERFGFGMCLADDMGLGKTIQMLALLLHERQNGQKPSPTLLVVPMSVVNNWVRESRRFGPDIRVLVHHGVERSTGDEFLRRVEQSDLIITTYALAHRDLGSLERVQWGRVVLDEAQCIKNPVAKQAQAVRSLIAERRVALTGTPVENRLSELWSIMDFLNPGLLGTSASFRKRFAVPVERYKDRYRTDQLRRLVQPFVLRRLKTDPTVVADLPPKLETRDFSHLTAEQAQLYDSCVKRMLGEVDRSEGMQRRGLVLAALIKLKQICNHPSQLLKDTDGVRPPDPTRSGKTMRLLEMLDEILAEGDQSLIFTQFRQMGHILQLMLQHELNRTVLFLHGGTTQSERQRLIDTFQKQDGQHPILILSLKAGGVGLNLTAATHVFHFDRWWNPAVENQATDRAYRIGQTRTVHVHKFIVAGTLEERIDEMIEQKTELASNIIGSGERWLTELSTDQLRDILTLRPDAVAEDA